MATSSPRKRRRFRWTRAHLERLPKDGNRYEVLDGALLVTPQAGMAHQRISAILAAKLDAYCQQHALGVVFASGAVVFSENELQPDVQVIPMTEREARVGDWKSAPTSLLAIEILSPGSERIDRGTKRTAYLGLGIGEYWVVDIEAGQVEVSRQGGESPIIVRDVVRWAPKVGAAPLEIDLVSLFVG